MSCTRDLKWKEFTMHIKSLKYSALAISAVAALSMAGPAQAQTENININTTVSNLLTVTPTAQLNFGTIALVSHASDTGEVTISTAGVAGVDREFIVHELGVLLFLLCLQRQTQA